MKVIEVGTFGGPEVLVLVERPRPEPGPGQVLIEVKAAGVNPVETYIRAGTYPRLPSLPFTPGGNAAGIVAECGPGAGDWRVGDRVYSAATLSGAYGEYTLCHTDHIHRLPENLSFAEGAAVGVPAATAWRALYQRGGCRRGVKEKVLVHGASGSVGQAAVQLAAADGMEVYGTASTEAGRKLVAGLGARHVLDHGEPDYQARLQEASGGFDLILEMLADRNLAADLEMLAPRGRVVIIGSRGRIEIDPRATMAKETDIRGLAIFSATSEELDAIHEGLARAMGAGELRPTVSRELPLAEAAEAHRLVLSSGICGKIVLRP